MLKYILMSFLFITNTYAYTCEEMGYTKSIADCPDGGLKCPAQPEKMFCCDPCGDRRGYLYDNNNCSPDDGLQLSGIECGGKWTRCEQCSSEYKYNHDNCRSPKILAGIQCGNAYTQCVYPVGSGCVPTVGYIYYADGSCHADYDDTKNPVGIILDASKKTIIALNEEKLTWNDGVNKPWKDIPDVANFKYCSDALTNIEGQSNTENIITYSTSIGEEYKAAMYCTNMTFGNKKWYIPTIGELNILYNNIESIQNALDKIPNTNKLTISESTNDYYWSSNEYYNMGAAGVCTHNLSNGKVNSTARHWERPTRCFSSF